jgi:L,D-transpeptidase catalytic domain
MSTPKLVFFLLLALVPAQLARASTLASQASSRPIAPLTGPISDEQTMTYWAYAVAVRPVRSGPSTRFRVIDSTRVSTEDGFPEDYLALAQEVYAHETWFKIRLPGRPNGRAGWVPEQALGVLQVTHKHLVINERARRLTLYSWGRKLFSAPVGIGKPSTPTPAGHYWIREKFVVHPADPFYGPYAFGTADYSTLSEWPHGGIVGIHGTNQPWLIPGAPSHGCVRMKDSDISRLWSLLPVGTPVTIL